MDVASVKRMLHASAIADDCVIMQGLHGIGKSNIVKQFGEENNFFVQELFLSHQEVGDLIGIPRVQTIDGENVTTWTVPIWLQRMRERSKDQPCILFLDELNRAPIDVRQSALQLVLERKIHEHELPEHDGKRTIVVAAVNPSDDYQVDELDPALIDRFLFIEVEPDAKAWLEWARRENVNSVVRDFISEHPDRLHYTPTSGKGATPRSWTKLGAYLDHRDEILDHDLFSIMKGKIGSEVGSQFYSYYINYAHVIKIADIEKIVNDNKDKVQNVQELSEIIKQRTNRIEAIQKTELAHNLERKYIVKKDMLVFLAYLYSLEMEICVSFLKGYRNDNPDGYKKLVKFDTDLNDKQLFKRIVRAIDSE